MNKEQYIQRKQIEFLFPQVFRGQVQEGDMLVNHTNPFFDWSGESAFRLSVDRRGLMFVKHIYAEYVRALERTRVGIGRAESQRIRLAAACETVLDFNGGLTLYPMSSIYGSRHQYEGGKARLIDFLGKQSMSCFEAATIAQIVLHPTDTVAMVTGGLSIGSHSEPHAFTLVRHAYEEHAEFLLDTINPLVRISPGRVDLAPYMEEIQAGAGLLSDGISIQKDGEVRVYQSFAEGI